MNALVGNFGPFVSTFDREQTLPNGDILQHTVKYEARFVPDTESFGTKDLTRETIIATARFRKCKWGPFAWWERIAIA